jgi:hypothetical protein
MRNPCSDNDTTERDSSQDYNGAPSYLPSRLDPSLHPTSNMSGVRWSPPVTLNAGDAMWIRRGWWHCIASEAGAVAVPLEVQHNVVAGDTPCVWRGVARVKTQRDGKKVSKVPGWHSGASVRHMWRHALAALGEEEQEKEEEEVGM